MVLSLTYFDDLPLSSNSRDPSPTPPVDPQENYAHPPSSTEATEESASQQNPTLPILALDPALIALSPLTPNRTTNPTLHSEDLTQFARHLALQNSLSKPNVDKLVTFTKRPLGEQLIWMAASQLSLNESVLAVFRGEVSPTLMKHIKQEVGKQILSPNLPAYKSERVGFDLIKDALLADQNSDVSKETLKDVGFCKKLKSAILTAWTKARSAIKTEIVQSLGDNPTSELDTEGLPNHRPSSISISQLSADVLENVPGGKGIKFTVALAAQIAFLWYCYTLSQNSGGDYWGLVDTTLEMIRETVKDPTGISQKFTKILSVDRRVYGPISETNRLLTDSAPPARQSSGIAAVAGSKRKRLV